MEYEEVVIIKKSEYEELIKKAAMLDAIERYAKSTEYISRETILILSRGAK